MYVLIYGYFGMGNIGDEAILSVLLDEYRSRGYECAVLSANPERTKRIHGVSACKDKLVSLSFWGYLARSRVLVFAGGGRYGDATVRRISLLAILAKLMGKRVEFRSVGFYPYEWRGGAVVLKEPRPFRRLITRMLLKMAIERVDYISIRDDFSKQVLVMSGVGREVNIEEDLAFKLTPASTGRACEILINHGVALNRKPIVGVNLRTLSSEIRFRLIREVAPVLDQLIDSGAEVVFVPFGFESFEDRFFDDDIIAYKELTKHMRHGNELKVIDREYHPREVLSIFRFFDLFIGMRFHSIIFSLIINIPTIVLIYDTKVVELLKNQKSKYCIPMAINELNRDKLGEAVNLILHIRD